MTATPWRRSHRKTFVRDAVGDRTGSQGAASFDVRHEASHLPGANRPFRSPPTASYTWAMAQPVMPPPGFDDLSVEEKIEYIEALWMRVEPQGDDGPFPEWQRELADQLNAEFEQTEMATRPWDEVRAELLRDRTTQE